MPETNSETNALFEEEAATVELNELSTKTKWIIVGVLAIAALISIFVLAAIFSDANTYTEINSTLDTKKDNVMALVASTTAASTAISLLPGDAGSAIATKLADLSSYFLIILSVIYLEKFLLTTFGFLAFAILFPVACALLAFAIFARTGTRRKSNLQQLSAKVFALGLALILVVPVSIWLTNSIDASFEATLAEVNAETEAATETIENSVDESEGGFFEGLVANVQQGWNEITQGVQNALDSLSQQFNTMIDTLAVMIVTSCLIPLIVLAFFLWLIKVITGLDFGGASGAANKVRTKGRGVMSPLRWKK